MESNRKKSLSLSSQKTVQKSMKDFFKGEASNLPHSSSSSSTLKSAWKPKPVAAIKPHQPQASARTSDSDSDMDVFVCSTPTTLTVKQAETISFSSLDDTDEIMTRGWCGPNTSARQPLSSGVSSHNSKVLTKATDSDRDLDDLYWLDTAQQESMIEEIPSSPIKDGSSIMPASPRPKSPVLLKTRSPKTASPRARSPVFTTRKFVPKAPCSVGSTVTKKPLFTATSSCKPTITKNNEQATVTSSPSSFQYRSEKFAPNSSLFNPKNASDSFRFKSVKSSENVSSISASKPATVSKTSVFKPKNSVQSVPSINAGEDQIYSLSASSSTTDQEDGEGFFPSTPPRNFKMKNQNNSYSSSTSPNRVRKSLSPSINHKSMTSSISDFFETKSVSVTSQQPSKLTFASINNFQNDDGFSGPCSKPSSSRQSSAATTNVSAVPSTSVKSDEDNESKVLQWISETAINSAVTKPASALSLSELQEMANTLKRLLLQFLDHLFLIWDSVFTTSNSNLAGKLRAFGLRIRAKNRLVENKIKSLGRHGFLPTEPNFRQSKFVDNLIEDEDNHFAPPANKHQAKLSQDATNQRLPVNHSYVGGGDSFLNTASTSGASLHQQKITRPVQKQTVGDHTNYQAMLYHTNSISPRKANESTTSKSLGKFHGAVINDGPTGEFSGKNFPHSTRLQEVFRKTFGLQQFRPNQLEAINAALLGHDTFILMPTGGGKSLCYQLPALITGGLTIVVSPLKSLIQDQVYKLQSLDIPTDHLSGDLAITAQNRIYARLNSPEPGLTLLYVTPEKISSSQRLMDALGSLYERGKLSRFVIDEAHCVSQWGHDFRPDYKKLNKLAESFPNVPLMALTATATPRVRIDVLHQLKMDKPKWFLSSFNRPNLQYSVIQKKTVEKGKRPQIIDLLQSSQLKGKCGIIYCLSRNDCHTMADLLVQHSIRAAAYHAGLSDKERASIQHKWTSDIIKVVCATIAFGMGIDKADVRFVIHYSVAKSIEGYYQEAGRAGRDGELAKCILMYNFADVRKIQRMIEQDASVNRAAVQVHMNNLFRMVGFCDNILDCRRTLQLNYFGEIFHRQDCIVNRTTACDNCLRQGNYEQRDVTELSIEIVKCIRDVCGTMNAQRNKFTLLHFGDVLKGSERKKIIDSGHERLSIHGKASSWTRTDVDRLLRRLLLDHYLHEEFFVVTQDAMAVGYVRCGPQADILLSGKIQVMFAVNKSENMSSTVSSPALKPADLGPNNDELVQVEEQCLRSLREKARELAQMHMVTISGIMNPEALRLMAKQMPETAEEMLRISHVTEANFKKYGAEFLKITKEHAELKLALLSEVAEGMVDEDAEVLDSIDMPVAGSSTPRGRGGYRGRKAFFKRKGSRGRSKSSGRANKRAKTSSGTYGKGGYSGGASSRGRKSSAASSSSSGMMALPVPKSRPFLGSTKVSSM